MFLQSLSNNERHLFLDMELYMSKIDGCFSEEEKRIIDMHAAEMHIDHNNYTPEHSVDYVRSHIKQLADAKKRICFFEIIAVALSDGVYDENERELINNLTIAFGFNEKDLENVIEAINMLKAGYEKATAFIKR